MVIGIKPFEIIVVKGKCYSLNLMNIIYGKRYNMTDRGIGFSYNKNTLPDRAVWRLNLFFYSAIKRIIVKTILDDYYLKCNECGGIVWKHNYYCQNCKCEMLPCEVSTIYRKSKETDKIYGISR